MKLLNFQREALAQFSGKTGLLVFASGLGIEIILESLLRIYSSSRASLVFLLNCPEPVVHKLLSAASKNEINEEANDILTQPVFFTNINSSISSEERKKIYLNGGVVSITSRILVVDMLLGRAPLGLTTGIVIFDAHKIGENSLERFVLDLYHDSENEGGFIQCLSDNPRHWCRSSGSLEKWLKALHIFNNNILLWPRFHESVRGELDKIDELEVTEVLQPISSSMLQIQTLLNELMDGCLKALDKTKYNTPDLSSADLFITPIIDLAPASRQLSTAVSSGYSSSNSRWIGRILNDIKAVKLLSSRLFSLDAASFKSLADNVIAPDSDISWTTSDPAFALLRIAAERAKEEMPKWNSVNEILNELMREHEKSIEVLVLTIDGKTAEYLTSLINEKLKKRKDSQASLDVSCHSLSEIQENNIFSSLLPSHIIIYDPILEFIRRIEVFKALHPQLKISVHFILYADSVEEQKYLLMIRKEKEAFEKLIYEKSLLPQRLDVGKSSPTSTDDISFISDSRLLTSRLTSTKIIVDMREFRSSLPYTLYQRGFEIIPQTIAVGDYILSPEIAVERKSIPDLVNSLSSGRLFMQLTEMIKTYERCYLLIELDMNNSFSMQAKHAVDSSINNDNISINQLSSKLILLLLHFPKIKVLWSGSDIATAQYFVDLKKDRNDPVVSTMNYLPEGHELNSAAIEMLMRCPGVTSFNVAGVLRNVRNMRELAKLSIEQLKIYLGEIGGRALFDFLQKRMSS